MFFLESTAGADCHNLIIWHMGILITVGLHDFLLHFHTFKVCCLSSMSQKSIQDPILQLSVYLRR